MKPPLLLLFAFSVTGINLHAQNITTPLPKLSASALQYLWKQEKQKPGNANPGYVYRTDAQNHVYLSILIEVQSGFNEAILEAMGVHIETKAGNIWTAQVPVEKMKDFSVTAGIKYMDMDQLCFANLDSARKVTRTDSVQNGFGLPRGFTGENVVVGIIDGGFDYTHPTLFDTSYTIYRVRRVWEEKTTGGTPPAGFSYGSEYADSNSILAKATDNNGTHGTHVAGIAAGSGYGSAGLKYRGMAYSSDLVLVGINPTNESWLGSGMTDMLDGMNYIFNYAESVGQPAVANLSWGSPMGPRDGNSLFSRACDNLTGAGKIFVISAGNDGTDSIHFQKTFTAADSIVSTFLTFDDKLTEKRNWVDVWGDSSKMFCMKFSLFNGADRIDSSVFICPDDNTRQLNLVGSNNDTCFMTVTTVSSEFNGKPHMLIEVFSRVADNLCLTLKSNAGTINMWQGYVFNNTGYNGKFVSRGFSWAANGDIKMTISDMVSTKSAIGVGAYNSKTVFKNVSGQNLQFPGSIRGQIASFSSIGPTTDGRTKPNITAPGLALASAVHSNDSSFLAGKPNYNVVVSKFISPKNNRTYSYALFAGTSMAAPCVTGITALLLQVNPHLTPQDLMNILYTTAIKDSYTGNIPVSGSNTWGFGKVNAYGAMKLVLGNAGIYHQESSLNCLVYPNPGHDNFEVEYISHKEDVLKLTVKDVSGRELMKEKWNVRPGSNTIAFRLNKFTAGIYLVHLTGKEGTAAVKIIKQ